MKFLQTICTLVFVMVTLASCKHDVSLETTVHEDGTLDKLIAVEPRKDSATLFNIKGWEKSIREHEAGKSDSTTSTTLFNIYQKSFASAEEANKELGIATDSTMAITSSFTKNFRWFYTYIRYTETYHAINRLSLDPDDYLTPEDYAFIDRLPAEGKKISNPDNLYLDELNKKIFDVYGTRALFEAYWDINIQLLKEYPLENHWLDTLNQHKEKAFALMSDDKSDNKIMDDYFLINFMERLHIPLPYETVKRDYLDRIKPFERTINFIMHANEGKYTHRINLPWTIVNSNADSVAGNSLFWAPPSIKFLVKDYTLYAECRKLNWWAVGVSILIVGFTGYLFIRKWN